MAERCIVDSYIYQRFSYYSVIHGRHYDLGSFDPKAVVRHGVRGGANVILYLFSYVLRSFGHLLERLVSPTSNHRFSIILRRLQRGSVGGVSKRSRRGVSFIDQAFPIFDQGNVRHRCLRVGTTYLCNCLFGHVRALFISMGP